jgi:hypothetical protein
MAEGPRQRVRLRAVVLGLVLVALNAYWLAAVELVRHTSSPTSVSLFLTAVLSFVVVVLANAGVRRVAPRAALTGPELATVYAVTTVGSSIAGIDFFCCMPPIAAYPFRYAKPENGWDSLFLWMLPKGLMVTDPVALRGFWEGGSSLYRPENWGAWLGPVLRWNAWALGMGGMWLGAVALFSPRWIESERLTYPIQQLPSELAYTPRRLLSSQAFVLALGAAALVTLLNGLHALKPVWPWIPVKAGAVPAFNLSGQLVDVPWNRIGTLVLSFYPFAIGLSILLPSRLSLSCWAFYLLLKLEYVFANQSFSWLSEGSPFTREQSLGAYLAIAAFALYAGRVHLRRTLREAWTGEKGARFDRPLAPRPAVVLSALSFGFLVWFQVRAGMSTWYALAFCGLTAALSFSFTRIRAEMGVPVHEMHLVGPGQVLPRWLGSRTVGNRSLVTSAAFYWYNYGQRCHPMPHMAEAMKLTHRGNASQQRMALVCLIALVVGGLSSCWAILHLYYRDGAAAKWGPWYPCEWIAYHPYNEVTTLLLRPTGPSTPMILASTVGFVVTFVLMQVQTRFVWWPLHPVGYAVANAWAMDNMWFSVFVAWAVKALVTRYAGAPGIRRLTYIAFGLVLGDFLMGGAWSLYGTARGIRTYAIWP